MMSEMTTDHHQVSPDPDHPPTTDAFWEGELLKCAGEPMGVVRTRREQKTPTKVTTTIRLLPEVVALFKSQGQGWQIRLDDVLREYVRNH